MRSSKRTPLPTTGQMSLAQASDARAQCEQKILVLLRQLSLDTGLGLVNLESWTVRKAEKKNGPERRVPMSVEITLAV